MDKIQEIATCDICARGCLLREGEKGACGNYALRDGAIREMTPRSYLLVCPISIETMPMLHYHPRGKFLQVTTAGCNFSCPGCVSTSFVKGLEESRDILTCHEPKEIISMARQEECLGITFMMNDPLASYFTFLELAVKAKSAGLLVGCATNAYFTEKRARELAPYLDFINVGMKGFSDGDYQFCGVSSLLPVLNNVCYFRNRGIHVEVSCLYRKGNELNLLDLARWIDTVDGDIPLQLMRYIPLEDASPEWEPAPAEGESLCGELRRILPYVYLFNTPGTESLNTRCPRCGEVLIVRDFYGPMGAVVRDGGMKGAESCPCCDSETVIISPGRRPAYRESGFAGGYPFTRALDMLESMLIAMGIKDKGKLISCRKELLKGKGLMDFHREIQSPESYLEALLKYGGIAGAKENARRLVGYMEARMMEVKRKAEESALHPRTLYIMGKSHFVLKGERFENRLIKLAGGVPVNDLIDIEGRPGMTVSGETLTDLNPQVIFVSSFLSNSEEALYEEYRAKGVKMEALANERIYTHPYPNIDFGSPRWILGLMHIANKLHPDTCRFSLEEEEEFFYRSFYGIYFDPRLVNRSFGKPLRNWRWDKGGIKEPALP